MESQTRSCASQSATGGCEWWWMAGVSDDRVDALLRAYSDYCKSLGGLPAETFSGFFGAGAGLGHCVLGKTGTVVDECAPCELGVGSGSVGGSSSGCVCCNGRSGVPGRGAAAPSADGGVAAGTCGVGCVGSCGGESSGRSNVGSSESSGPGNGGAVEPQVVVKGKNWVNNQRKRAAAKRRKMSEAWRQSRVPVVDGAGGCVSDASTAQTVDTRTAIEIEAAQTLAERRVAENRLAVAQANAKTASFADKAKTEAWERLSGARMSQRINQANAAAHKAYNAQDKSLQSVDSAGSAGEFALRQMIKEARNSQFVSAYVQKQNELLVRHADPHVLEAIKRIPKPKLDNMFDVLEEQYERMGPEQRAQLDVDANVANAKWDEKLYMGEGVLDDPLPSDGKPSAALQEMMRKVKLQGEMIASGYESQRAAAEKIKV